MTDWQCNVPSDSELTFSDKIKIFFHITLHLHTHTSGCYRCTATLVLCSPVMAVYSCAARSGSSINLLVSSICLAIGAYVRQHHSCCRSRHTALKRSFSVAASVIWNSLPVIGFNISFVDFKNTLFQKPFPDMIPL